MNLKIIVSCILMSCSLFAERGMVVACCDKYMKFLPTSLEIIRNVHHSKLPIEVWHSGGELSEESKERLMKFAPLEFCDVTDHYPGDEKEYWGFQIKGLMLAKTKFDEVLLFDADVFFFQNPEVLFDFDEYKETGAYFFRDRVHSNYFFYGTLEQRKNYLERRDFFLNLISKPSRFVPKDWQHYWNLDILPTKKNPINSEHMESGFMAVDKNRHQQGIKMVEKLNLNYRVTYSYVIGDKETFWLGFESVKEPYTINEDRPKILLGDQEPIQQEVGTVQFVKGKLFYQQKAPIALGTSPLFMNTEDYSQKRPLTKKEWEQLTLFYFIHGCETREKSI